MKFRNKYIQLIFLVLTICLYYHIAFQIKRSEFGLLMFDITLLFLLYIFALKYFEFYWWLAILPRLVFITAIPGLSDDYFRFIWDGNLLVNGMNPYQYLPSSFPQNEVYEGLNSKNYYSVYPPLLQLFFGISAFFAKGSIFSNIICLRIFILFADLGSIFLINKILRYLKLPTKYALIYTLNPLIILELTGNLHFEAVSIFFLLLSFYYLQFIQYNETKYLLLSAIALAFAALIKLLPPKFTEN